MVIRQLYPDACIVRALGSMDATRPGSPWPGYVKARSTNDARVGTRALTLLFPFTREDQHPGVKQHRANAAMLTAFVREQMGW